MKLNTSLINENMNPKESLAEIRPAIYDLQETFDGSDIFFSNVYVFNPSLSITQFNQNLELLVTNAINISDPERGFGVFKLKQIGDVFYLDQKPNRSDLNTWPIEEMFSNLNADFLYEEMKNDPDRLQFNGKAIFSLSENGKVIFNLSEEEWERDLPAAISVVYSWIEFFFDMGMDFFSSVSNMFFLNEMWEVASESFMELEDFVRHFKKLETDYYWNLFIDNTKHLPTSVSDKVAEEQLYGNPLDSRVIWDPSPPNQKTRNRFRTEEFDHV